MHDHGCSKSDQRFICPSTCLGRDCKYKTKREMFCHLCSLVFQHLAVHCLQISRRWALGLNLFFMNLSNYGTILDRWYSEHLIVMRSMVKICILGKSTFLPLLFILSLLCDNVWNLLFNSDVRNKQ